MKTTNVLALALAALLVCGRAQATSITAVGLDSTTGGSWRTAAAMDIDNNNTYGSAGYIAFATGANGNGGNFVSPLLNPTLLSALPVWAPVTLTGLNSSYSAMYGNFDNPAGPGQTQSGFAWDAGLVANTNTSLLDITVGTVGTFRLGVIQNGAGGTINSFTLESGAASAIVNVNKIAPDDSHFRYALFDVTAAPGTVLTLEINGVPNPTGGNDPLGISGLTFDLRPVPEPSSLVLAGLALAGFVGVGLRRRRAALALIR